MILIALKTVGTKRVNIGGIMKTKRLPVLNRFEKHQGGKNVPVYRIETVEVDDKGQPVWNKKGEK
jgi:hypothetical protein